MRILVDTNVLLRLRDLNSPHHWACVGALDRLRVQNEEVFVCAQVLIEYWTVATRPTAVRGLGLEPDAVDLDLQDILTFAQCLPEPADIFNYWRDLVVRHSTRGLPTHDARLVALMLAHGVTHIVTLNTADFSRYTEITCLHPVSV